VREHLGAVPTSDFPREEPGHQLRRRVQRHHASLEVDRHDAGGQRGQDVVRVGLEIGEVLEATPQLGVRVLQGHPLLRELAHHVVERDRQPADLVVGRRLDALVPVTARDAGGTFGQLLDRLRDAAGDEGGAHAAEEQHDEREGGQLRARLHDLRLHALLGDADARGAPLLAIHENRHREVEDGLAGHRGFLQHGLHCARRLDVDFALQRHADAIGVAAVGSHLGLRVEHDRVHDVRLAGDARHVLLERREVVEEQGALRDGGQTAGHDVAAALHLLHDRRPLVTLDEQKHAGHRRHDHEHGAPQQARAQRPQAKADHRASHTLRIGMYGSPSPLTSTERTQGWNRRS